MRRIAKSLGLSLGALAVTAIAGLPTASAVQFHGEAEPTYLSGKYGKAETEWSRFDFKNPIGAAVKCSEGVLSGQIPKTTSEITLTPTNSGCSFLGLEVHWKTNNCDYLFNVFGGVGMVCPPGQFMQLSVTFNGVTFCKIFIFPQALSGSVKYANNGSGSNRDVSMVWSVEKVSYSIVEPVNSTCGTAGQYGDGKLTGTVTLKGFKAPTLLEQVGFWVE